MNRLIGGWILQEWDCTVDGRYLNHPFGPKAKGSLLYTADFRMAAILMKPNRPHFKVSNLIKGLDKEKIAAVEGYVSYGGRYRIEGNQVIHSVEYSLLPNWIGTDLVRTISWTNETNPQLILTTPPYTTSGGKQIINRLRWLRT